MASRALGLRAGDSEAALQIRVSPIHRLPPDLVEAAHTHAAFALTRFSRAIRTVTVKLGHLNGPNGGVDQTCTVTIDLARASEPVVVTDIDADAFAALARAMVRAARAVARRLDRRRSWRVAGDGDPGTPGQTDRQSP